jgi:hypothetical protein
MWTVRDTPPLQRLFSRSHEVIYRLYQFTITKTARRNTQLHPILFYERKEKRRTQEDVMFSEKNDQRVSQADTLKGRMNGSKKLTIHINNRGKHITRRYRNANSSRHDEIISASREFACSRPMLPAATSCIHDRLTPQEANRRSLVDRTPPTRYGNI